MCLQTSLSKDLFDHSHRREAKQCVPTETAAAGEELGRERHGRNLTVRRIRSRVRTLAAMAFWSRNRRPVHCKRRVVANFLLKTTTLLSYETVL